MPVVSGFTVVLGDRVRETTQTTGTGTYSLDGAATGMRTFVAGISSGNRTLYTVALGADYEIGIGTVTSGAPATVTRDAILVSSNTNNAVNWAPGIKDIFCDAPATLFNTYGQGTAGTRDVGVSTSTQIPDRGLADTRYLLNQSLPYDDVIPASGVGVTFTGIPATARHIVVTLTNVSVSSTGGIALRIGDAGGVETTGYDARAMQLRNTTGIVIHGNADTDRFRIASEEGAEGLTAASIVSGTAMLTRTGTITWVLTSQVLVKGASIGYWINNGEKALTTTLDRVFVFTGTGSLDAGSIGLVAF